MPRNTAKPFHQLAWAAELGALMTRCSPEVRAYLHFTSHAFAQCTIGAQEVAEHVWIGRAHGIVDVSWMALWSAGNYRRLTAMLTQANALGEAESRDAVAPVITAPTRESRRPVTIARVMFENEPSMQREDLAVLRAHEEQRAPTENHAYTARSIKRKRGEEESVSEQDEQDDEEMDQLDSDDGQEPPDEQDMNLGRAAFPSLAPSQARAVLHAQEAQVAPVEAALKKPKVRVPPVQGEERRLSCARCSKQKWRCYDQERATPKRGRVATRCFSCAYANKCCKTDPDAPALATSAVVLAGAPTPAKRRKSAGAAPQDAIPDGRAQRGVTRPAAHAMPRVDAPASPLSFRDFMDTPAWQSLDESEQQTLRDAWDRRVRRRARLMHGAGH